MFFFLTQATASPRLRCITIIHVNRRRPCTRPVLEVHVAWHWALAGCGLGYQYIRRVSTSQHAITSFHYSPIPAECCFFTSTIACGPAYDSANQSKILHLQNTRVDRLVWARTSTLTSTSFSAQYTRGPMKKSAEFHNCQLRKVFVDLPTT